MRTQVLAGCAAFVLGLLVWSVDAAEEPRDGAAASAPTTSEKPREPRQDGPDKSSAPRGGAPTPDDPYAVLPKVMVDVVREMEAQCRAADGRPAWSAEHMVEVLDFSRDGHPDYLLKSSGMQCLDGDTPWRGSDGFRYVLFVSTGFGRWTRAFDRRARDIEVRTDGEPSLWLFSHLAYCTRANPKNYQRCEQVYAWRNGKLRKVSEDWFTG